MNLVYYGRPKMPTGYGLSQVDGPKDLLAWEKVEEQLMTARNYWIGSTFPDGRPHAMPVWGVWMADSFFFSTDVNSRKGKNLAANPEAAMHLESGDEVVILEGKVAPIGDTATLKKVDRAYFAKYRYHLIGDQAPPGLVYQLRARKIFAWSESSFPNSATQWRFEVE
jgi:hypothetical protein